MANLEQDLQFIGVDDTIEIWSPQRLKESLKTDEEFGAALEDIMNTDNAQ
jgi:MraZ protein